MSDFIPEMSQLSLPGFVDHEAANYSRHTGVQLIGVGHRGQRLVDWCPCFAPSVVSSYLRTTSLKLSEAGVKPSVHRMRFELFQREFETPLVILRVSDFAKVQIAQLGVKGSAFSRDPERSAHVCQWGQNLP